MLPDPQEVAIELAGEVVLRDAPGEVIREARNRYGFTQAWLAKHLDVRRESLSRIESGHSKPTLDVVARFARILSLARHVRAYAARQEKDGGKPNYVHFRTIGRELGLSTETSDEVAREALESYSAKRDALLEDITRSAGERT